MEENSHCIECGGDVAVTRPSLTVRVENCLDCGRRSHWRVCLCCGELNGPRRPICLECGVSFERQEAAAKLVIARKAAIGAAAVLSR
jgi:hypothetical protein